MSLFASLSLDVLPKVTSVFPIDSNPRYEHLYHGCDLKIDLEPGAVGGFFCCGKTVKSEKPKQKLYHKNLCSKYANVQIMNTRVVMCSEYNIKLASIRSKPKQTWKAQRRKKPQIKLWNI